MTPESKLLLVIGKIPASKRGKSTSLLIPIPSSIRDCPNYQIFACYLDHFISLYFMISPSSCSHFIAVTPRSHLLHFGHENPFPDGERDDWFIHRVVPLVPSGWWFQHVSTILKNMSSSMGRMTSLFYSGKIKNVWNHQPVNGYLFAENWQRSRSKWSPLADSPVSPAQHNHSSRFPGWPQGSAQSWAEGMERSTMFNR